MNNYQKKKNIGKITTIIYESPEEEEYSVSKTASKVGHCSMRSNRLSRLSSTKKRNPSRSESFKVGLLLDSKASFRGNETDYLKASLGNGIRATTAIDTNYTDEEAEIQPITYNEAYNYFSSSKIYNSLILKEQKRQEASRSCMTSCCSCLIGRISPSLEREKNLMTCLVRTKYDSSKEVDFRILATLYIFFTKERKCPKEGEHWQKIGFQSDKPDIDLLTVGMFGPFQLLYCNNKYPRFSLDLYKFLLSHNCDWIFVQTMFDISKIVIYLLDKGVLDFYFNRNGKVSYILNELFVGMAYYLNEEVTKYGTHNSLTAQFIANTIHTIKTQSYTQINYYLTNHA